MTCSSLKSEMLFHGFFEGNNFMALGNISKINSCNVQVITKSVSWGLIFENRHYTSLKKIQSTLVAISNCA